ncbi:Hypothetical predicted protein [Paramuricea clavata]|nr:Hypothetical predicted protein [Paramuricea clavata]
MDSRKNGRTGSLQKRHVFRQTYREPSVPAVKNLEPDTIIPREESFVFQTLVNKPRLKPRNGGKHGHRKQNYHINNNDQSAIECSRDNFDEQVTCSSHVYTFNRGLVPSRDAHNLELFHTQHFLPPVVADRIGNITEQKHYRLPREKDEKSSNDASYFLNALYSNDQSLEKNTKSKPVVYKEFSAETVIPAAYGRRRYFDFQGYIQFLCKERNLRKTSSRQLDDWGKLESSSWLNNLSDALVKDVFDYSRVLDIKGSRMKLDENPVQIRYQAKPLSEPNQSCFLGNSNKVYFKPQKTLKVTPVRNRKPKGKTILIERLPSKFQFTLPGRPPSSDDSGFAE